MKSISEIREEFRNLNPEQIEEKIEHFRTDESKGVQKLLETERKKLARYKEELERIENERKTYSRLTAILGDYLVFYTVDPETEDYYEYFGSEEYKRSPC